MRPTLERSDGRSPESLKIQKSLLKMEESVLEISPAERINLIGDPGCDGLGAGIMILTSMKSFSVRPITLSTPKVCSW